MSHTPITHTFHLLDIPKLDQLFSNYDDYTDLELEANQGATARVNRVIYAVVRKVAQVAEIALYCLVALLKGLVNLVRYAALAGKVVILTIAKTPMAVRKKFWPTQSELLHKRVDLFNQALSRKTTPLVKPLFTEKGRKLSHDEKKEMCHAWVAQNPTLVCTEELKELDSLLAKLADGNLSETAYGKIEERILKITTEFKNKFPNLHLPEIIEAFVKEFRAERKMTNELPVPSSTADLATILNHPNMLKREDVEKAIHLMPDSPLRTRALQKMDVVHQQAIKSAHQTEEAILEDLSTKLKTLPNIEELLETYFPKSRIRYLEERTEALNEQIQEIGNNNQSELQQPSFATRLLMLEQKYLTEQYDLVTADRQTVYNESKNIPDIQNIRHNELKSVYTLLVKRIEATLERLSSIPLDTDIELSELQGQFNDIPPTIEAAFDQENLLSNILTFTKELHALEKRVIANIPLPQKTAYLRAVQLSLSTLTNEKENIDAIHNASFPWIETIQTCQQRDLERQDAFAKEIICLTLEKKAECQLPLKLANKDARADKNRPQNAKLNLVETKLESLATEFVTSIQEKYLEKCKLSLPSLREFLIEIEGNEAKPILNPTKQVMTTNENLGFDFEKFAQDLEISQPLQKWYTGLQQVWVDHLPREQEDAILAISNREELEKKMAEYFSAWVLEKTHTRLMASLSFKHIEIQDLSSQREEALDKMQQAIWDKQLRQRKGSVLNIAQWNKATSTPAHPYAGFDISLIAQEPLPFHQESVKSYANQYETVMNGSQTYTNSVQALREARAKIVKNFPPTIEERCQWILELSGNKQFVSLRDLRLMILAECELVAEICFKQQQVVPEDILNIFMKQFDLQQVANLERRSILRTFLHMVFSSRPQVQLTEIERAYLVQIAALSDLPAQIVKKIMDRIVGTDQPSDLPSQFAEFGRKLQESSIGLEGIEESTLQKSFQQSGLPNTPETRRVLDLWRSRSGEELLADLLRFSLSENLASEQGREIVSRALYHAYKGNQQGLVLFIQQKLTEQTVFNDQFNEETLAPPLSIFYQDCLLTTIPDDVSANNNVQQFNETLIVSKNVHQRFMGYAREITRLSRHISILKDETFARLLKYKIAYQTLKVDYYEGKKEIAGFLKIATNDADLMMLSTMSDVQQKLAQPQYLETKIRPLLLDNQLPTEKFSDKILREVFKERMADPLEADPHVPGFASLGYKVQIDGMLGIIYYDGTQKTSLPPQLQNHPYIRSLGIHTLPYVFNSVSKAYCYLTGSGKMRVPQVMVTESNDQPIIQKRLPTEFGGTKLEFLQFISKEQLSLPYAAAHRMGIRDFWQDAHGSIYAFDSAGDLVAILKQSNLEWTLTAKNQKEYLFNATATHPIGEYLLKSFNPNDILVSKQDLSVWIPSIGLRLNKAGDEWQCECKGIVGKILDTTTDPSSYFSLKNEGGTQRASRLRDQLILAQKHLVAAETPGSSRLSKQATIELERKRARIVKDLSEAEGRICLSTLSEPAFEQTTDLFGYIDTLIPSNLEKDWGDYKTNNSNNLQFSFQVYQLALSFLSAELHKSYAKCQNDDPQAQEMAQKHYLEIEPVYQKVQEQYLTTCDRPTEWVLFKRTVDNTIFSSDLAGALTLTMNGIKEPLQLIKELAKYPILQPLSDSQLALLIEAQQYLEQFLNAHTTPQLAELSAYLSFMQYQHHLYQIEELAHTPLSDKMDRVEETLTKEVATKNKCLHSINHLQTSLDIAYKLSPELIALWRKTILEPEALAKLTSKAAQKQAPDITAAKAVATNEFVYLGQQSLLERLLATKSVLSAPKNLDTELSDQQKSLIKSFQMHSPEQVSGFYLEEMGRFNLAGFYAEFRLNFDTNRALFGLNQEQLERLFTLVAKETCQRNRV